MPDEPMTAKEAFYELHNVYAMTPKLFSSSEDFTRWTKAYDFICARLREIDAETL